MDVEIDSLVNAFQHQTTVQFKPKHTFIQDVNIIVQELINYNTFIGLDIYEVLVSCGHNLTWNQDYYITPDDLNWFKNDGKTYFFSSINTVKPLENINEYRSVIDIHLKLSELFELQLE
tara:strand:- start:759 stop:1115 length:357 start_codon:yes stop_codon:yes gene_type:complete